MSPIAGCLLAALLAAAPLADAQSEGERGTQAPGKSQDGTRPAHGAIKGGSIETDASRSQQAARCNQLDGRLRIECLRDIEQAPTRDASGNDPKRTSPR